MPPKLASGTLIARMQNATHNLYELFDEFNTIYETRPQIERLNRIFIQVESKYRKVKQQLEDIADRLIDEGASTEDEASQANRKFGKEIKADYLQIAEKFALYENECSTPKQEGAKQFDNAGSLEAMTAAVTKMAKSLEVKSNPSGLERLSVPSWDGTRRSYATFKKEFNHWMTKYKQDEEEQLQRFRKAMPKGWWSDQVTTCKSITQAWSILDVEFEDKRKLMDSLLTEINDLKAIKRDSKSLMSFSTTVRRYVNDMEDNDCSVTKSTESPFFMSQLLSKLDPRDNVEYGREMQRQRKSETVMTLIEWLHQEANLRSRGKRDDNNADDDKADKQKRSIFYRRSDSHAVDSTQAFADDDCILGCPTKHLLQTCTIFQSLTVSQRWDIVKQNKRCRKCLRLHHTNDCQKADGTSCDKCTKNHHRLLHSEKKENLLVPSFIKPPAISNNNAQTSSRSEKTKSVAGLCPIQKIKAVDDKGTSVELLAMLDSGSNTSLLSKSAAKRLNLSGSKTHLTMNLAGGGTRSEESDLLEITIMPINEQSIKKTLSVYTVQKPCSSAKTVSKKLVESYKHLKQVSDEIYLAGGTVDLLIGTDFADAFVDIHSITGETGEPIAKRNCFGWYILGQFHSTSMTENIQFVDVGTVSIAEDIKSLIQQDQLGIKPTEFCTCNDKVLQESKFIKSLSKSTTLVEGRVQIKMPWKDTGPPKQSNYDIAYKRMKSSERSFNKKNCFEVVEKEVQKLIDQGFITQVPSDQIDHNKPEWYLPLQAVFTPDKTTKVRLVFDSSSKGHDGLSLNDHLEKGPNYINNLCDILLAWRWDSVAYSGDIRKMFNQITVHPEDQIFHRFLWRKSPQDPPTVYQWLRLNFGDKPAPDIATNTINFLAKSSEDQFPEAAAELREHAYVDDIGGSKMQSSEAKKVIKDLDTILSKGQFKIKAWHSNNRAIDQSEGDQFTDLLGHRWNKDTDTFSLKRNAITAPHQNLTKRNCLALLAQIWDPIGLVSPVTVKFRIDLQDLWSSGFNWDDVLPDSLQQKWRENLEVMNHLLTFEFKRQLKPSNAVGPPEVHGFSDGGELAYGAVIFLRWELKDGSYKCVPIMIKPFVAPLEKKSIPRLELLGCLALTRMYDSCTKALNFAKINNCRRTFWVDSSTVLSWLKTPPKEFKPFVSARVAEIQETVDTNDFKYIRSKHNPADALTRGIKAELLNSWFNGPEFLQRPESEWPTFEEEPKGLNGEPSLDAETRREKKTSTKNEMGTYNTRSTTIHLAAVFKGEEKKDNPILSHLLTSCSTFQKVRRTLAYVLRFVQKAAKKSTEGGPLTVKELSNAEKHIFKFVQLKVDVTKLDKGLIAQADKDGIVRAHGRLENVQSLPHDMRNPIILPKDHPLVERLIIHLHNERRHCGYKSLIHETRKRFWIVGVRSMAKRLTRECVVCRKLRRKPLEQLMGQIPHLRVATSYPAFTNTALDMFGPIQIRLNRKTLKEAQIIIFTCMTTRAVHLELVTDKSTETFLMAFRRFASLRGHPSVCWSDQGTNFVGSQHYLEEIMKQWDLDKIQTTLSNDFTCDFKWEWNIPTASHQNGVVESLIKSVRQTLDATCKNQSFSEEQWRTFLAETSYIINSRPLYPSSDNIWESPPITPNDILMGRHISPPQPLAEEKVSPRDLVRSTQKRIEEFWCCWMKYFSPNLLPRNKWYRNRENVAVGDLVLLIDPKQRRTKWNVALVVTTYPGDDGLVRKVRVKTQTGQYDRPIHKLCLIATHQELQSGN